MNKIYYIALFFSILFVQSNIDIDNINDYELNENMKYLINEDDGYNSESNVPIFEYLEIDNNSNDNSQDSLSILFGYDFFLNADKLLNIDNLPATADYTLGPGDEIIVSIWGEINSYENYTIDRNGNVFIDEVGQVFVSGKTLESSQNILFDKYSEIYSTMKGASENGFLTQSLLHFGFESCPFYDIFSSLNEGLQVFLGYHAPRARLIVTSEPAERACPKPLLSEGSECSSARNPLLPSP